MPDFLINNLFECTSTSTPTDLKFIFLCMPNRLWRSRFVFNSFLLDHVLKQFIPNVYLFWSDQLVGNMMVTNQTQSVSMAIYIALSGCRMSAFTVGEFCNLRHSSSLILQKLYLIHWSSTTTTKQNIRSRDGSNKTWGTGTVQKKRQEQGRLAREEKRKPRRLNQIATEETMLMVVGLLGHSFNTILKLGHSFLLKFYIYTFEHLFGLLQEGNLESTVTLSSSVVLCLHPFEVWFGLLLKDFGVRESVKKMFFF